MVFEIISTDGKIRINSLLFCIDQKFYVFRNLIHKKDYRILLKKFNYFLNEKRTKDIIAFIKFLFCRKEKRDTCKNSLVRKSGNIIVWKFWKNSKKFYVK